MLIEFHPETQCYLEQLTGDNEEEMELVQKEGTNVWTGEREASADQQLEGKEMRGCMNRHIYSSPGYGHTNGHYCTYNYITLLLSTNFYKVRPFSISSVHTVTKHLFTKKERK